MKRAIPAISTIKVENSGWARYSGSYIFADPKRVSSERGQGVITTAGKYTVRSDNKLQFVI